MGGDLDTNAGPGSGKASKVQGRIQRGGPGVRTPPPRPPLEFWQKSGYQIRDWDRFDIAQHLCKLQS